MKTAEEFLKQEYPNRSKRDGQEFTGEDMIEFAESYSAYLANERMTRLELLSNLMKTDEEHGMYLKTAEEILKKHYEAAGIDTMDFCQIIIPAMEAYKNQSQPIEKEQALYNEIKDLESWDRAYGKVIEYKNKRIRELTKLVEIAFIAGRSKQTWESFKSESLESSPTEQPEAQKDWFTDSPPVNGEYEVQVLMCDVPYETSIQKDYYENGYWKNYAQFVQKWRPIQQQTTYLQNYKSAYDEGWKDALEQQNQPQPEKAQEEQSERISTLAQSLQEKYCNNC